MGLHLTVEVDQRVIVCTFAGGIDDADVLSIRSLIAAHPDFDPSFSEILNFSGVTTANLSTAAIEIVSRRASAFDRYSMHIIVAPQDFIFGLGRMTQVFAENTRPNTAVVRTMEEARALLAMRRTRPT